MTHRWLRLLPMLIAALWLPLQAVAAVAMPFCGQGDDMPALAAAAAMPDDCPMHQPTAPGGHEHGPGCDHCGFCHLAAAGFLPSAEAAAPVAPFDEVFAAASEAAPASHIPEPPQQPPRRPA